MKLTLTRIGFIAFFLFILIGCHAVTETEVHTRVGLLLPENIDDQGWNSKGYEGLLKIHSKLNVDVFYKEEVKTLEKVEASVKEFNDIGVNLVFGHSQIYAPLFMEIKDQYPNMHFIVFNGEVSGENITSLNFKGYSMGFFAGMLASEMTETNVIGVIAAYPWQSEVDGFVEGALYKNKDTNVVVNYVSNLSDTKNVLKLFDEMVVEDVDVFYPTGDSYHVPIIEEVRKHGLYGIGFIEDHSDLGQSTILTSTIQHVDELYEITAEKYLNGELESGNQYFDFAEGVISLGMFSPDVPIEIQDEINSAINSYIETGKLPSELNP